jgi:hypothetical protein
MVNQTILPRVKLPKNPNPRIARYHIEAKTCIDSFVTIEAESKKLGLDMDLPKIRITGNKGNVCRTDSAKNLSIECYERVWKDLLDWSITHKD